MLSRPTSLLIALTLAPHLACADPSGTDTDTAAATDTAVTTTLTTAPDPSGSTSTSSESDTDAQEPTDSDSATDSTTGSATDSTTDTDDPPEDPEQNTPPLYPGGRVHSPLTPFVQESLASIRALAPAAPADLFIKVGASSTVSPHTLHCFAGAPDLDLYEPTLGPTLDFFRAGEAPGSTPFDRKTLAAEVGRTAGWAITGDPSPLDQEYAAIHPDGPSLALIHYGANDMQMAVTYAAALPGYYRNMSALLDTLIDRGVVPVVFGLSRRQDSPAADLWVQTYNAVARGLAQARLIPFIDLHHALEGLPNYGVSGDGLHLSAAPQGACELTPDGLQYGYNVRNLIALAALDRLRAALVDGHPVLGEAHDFLQGEGTVDAPLEIPRLPFADARSTTDAPSLDFDVYSGCDALADESGPENIYRLVLDQPTELRAVVLDHPGVDVDLHLLDDTATEAGCLARGDRLVSRTLPAGTYFFSVDTYVDGQGNEFSGEYTFVVLACEPGDLECY
ncbi:MAG: SGNH/GDSL hydrolase family protein [Nannocystis sp.]|nr:SGNH/GDSL hydrolase family protein [Nannocystis sp.]